MSEKYSVIIVGAGAMGCSIAYHLTQLGAEGVCIVDKEATPGCGSTGKANGGIRAQFTTRANVALSLKSMEILDELAPKFGEPPLYHKIGYLFMTADEESVQEMAGAVSWQRKMGASVELLDGDEVRRLATYVDGADIVGGTFGERDGLIDPGRLTNWFFSAARKMGAEAKFYTEVTSLEREPSGDFRVGTASGELFAPVVVNAAGPYAASIAAKIGVELPVLPVRRHSLVTGPCVGPPDTIPMTIDADSGLVIRREGPAIIIAYANPEEPPGFNETFDRDFVEKIAGPLERRFPAVAEAGIDFRKSWVGHYAVSPDHNAILGLVPGVEGFYLANGFSGHGAMHSPAVGLCLAELIARGRSESVDIAPFGLERFKLGRAAKEAYVL